MLTYFILTGLIIGTTKSQDNLYFEIENLKAELRKLKQNLTDEVASLRSALIDDGMGEQRKKRILMHSDTDTAMEISKLREEVKQLRQGRGSVYIRWGRTDCPQVNGTTRIYKGYMAGKHYKEAGGGTNELCLPDDPTWGNYQDTAQTERAFIYGAEFRVSDKAVFGKSVNYQDIPCAVCKVPGVSVLIPARGDCYSGWNLEYTGYLMAAHYAHYAQEYICMDSDPDFVVRGSTAVDSHLLYLVEGVCGTLVCPPYYNRRELACVVCSI